MARSLEIICQKTKIPIGSSEVLSKFGKEILFLKLHEGKTYENDTKRHITVGHGNKGNTSLIQDGEIVLATIISSISEIPIVVEVVLSLRGELGEKSLSNLGKVTS